MAKAPLDIRSLARSHTVTAINVLAGIMNEPTSGAPARVSAAQILLDRGWGKAVQPIAGEDGRAIQFERIERVIVDHVLDLPTATGGTATVLQLVRSEPIEDQ